MTLSEVRDIAHSHIEKIHEIYIQLVDERQKMGGMYDSTELRKNAKDLYILSQLAQQSKPSGDNKEKQNGSKSKKGSS